jgi:hypothetical protein
MVCANSGVAKPKIIAPAKFNNFIRYQQTIAIDG